MSVQSRLTRLVLVTCLLGAGAAALGGWFVYHKQSQATEQSLGQSAHAIAELIDSELGGTAKTLQALAGATTLRHGDLASFYQTISQAAGGPESTIVLREPGGQQILNTRRPFGSPLPTVNDGVVALRNQAGPTVAVVTNLFSARLTRQPEFAIEVPVYIDGKLLYFLTRGLPAATLQPLLTRQGFPENWRLSVVDRAGVVVARSSGQAEFAGRRADQSLLDKVARASSGVNEGVTLDGIPVKAFYHQAPWSRWTVVLSVPAAELYAPARMAAFLLAGLIVLLLGGAALAARRLARQIAQPVQRLRDAAEMLGEGKPIHYLPVGLAEIDAVGAAMATAAGKIASGQEQLEARVRDAVARTEQAQQALQRAQKLEVLGRLTGGVAHDFNNVLQTLTSAMDLIRRDPDPAHLARRIEVCDQAIGRAAALIAKLRSFGRIQDAVLREVDMNQLLLASASLLRNAVGKHALLNIEYGEGLGHALIDPVQFDMALLNLVINARDAVAEGGHIEVRALMEPSGQTIRIVVSDNGRGMPPEVMARASEPFFTTKESGMGLGLAQVFAFAKQTEGDVTIDSSPGRGTTVILRLPCALVSPVLPNAGEGEASSHAVSTVLVVDDEALIRDTTGAALQHLGWRVLTAENAEQALAMLEQQPGIEVLLSDIVMPGAMNGIALARDVRRRWPELAVVLATAYAHERIGIEGIEVLAKPYRIQDIQSAIERALKRSAAAA